MKCTCIGLNGWEVQSQVTWDLPAPFSRLYEKSERFLQTAFEEGPWGMFSTQ